MSFKGNNFNDRAADSVAAKKALLERARARAAATAEDPAVQERMAARKAAAEAREQRETEKRLARQAEAARKRAEEEARQAEAARIAAEEAKRASQSKLDLFAMLAKQKAARDAQAAARKAKR